MKKYFAKQGEIPKQGEIWLPVGDKGHRSYDVACYGHQKNPSFYPRGT